jgi:hypothetical protein
MESNDTVVSGHEQAESLLAVEFPDKGYGLESETPTGFSRDAAKKPHAQASVGTASLLMIADIVGVGV